MKFLTPEDGIIEFDVYEKDLIVKVKQKIRDNLPIPKNVQIKLMKLRYNNIDLDDNEFLLKYVDSPDAVVQFEPVTDNSARDLVILIVEGQLRVHQMFQLNKSDKISTLRENLIRVTGVPDFDLFKDMEELINENTIEQSGLDDYGKVNLMAKIVLTAEDIALQKNLAEAFKNDPNQYYKKKAPSKYHRHKQMTLTADNKRVLGPQFAYGFNDAISLSYQIPIKIDGVKMDTDPFAAGTFSEIFKARDLKSNKIIVVKRYNCDQKLVSSYKRVLNDLIAFQKKNPNPRFVQLICFHGDIFTFCMVMEYVEHGSMDNYVKRLWPFPDKQVKKWCGQILEGLAYLHGHKIIYRDLKPSNIYLDEYNNVKLCGFSLSMFLMGITDDELKKNYVQSHNGVFSYMSPEILNGDLYDEKVDVWSFGGTLINMVTGKNPCPTREAIDTAFYIARNLAIEYTLPATTNALFTDVIGRCVRSTPSERPTVEELIKDFVL